ncbi:hypothetical protein L596_023627 [Steinernema carpocapsae]|uniref:Saposin B-type domain-containing protein n=1 Tax=Steinernema carpocapsae TaxID=34508 RepID=A0A4U5ME93_STECR|nr:hypothetical protein L596_023627 [Steinernema carpocapsae]
MKTCVCFLLTLSLVLVVTAEKKSKKHLAPSFQCRACHFIDAVLLDTEKITGAELCDYLEHKCAQLGVLYTECKNLVDTVVDRVEEYGHLLDQDELCSKILKVCNT